jgi:hypothetical protein
MATRGGIGSGSPGAGAVASANGTTRRTKMHGPLGFCSCGSGAGIASPPDDEMGALAIRLLPPPVQIERVLDTDDDRKTRLRNVDGASADGDTGGGGFRDGEEAVARRSRPAHTVSARRRRNRGVGSAGAACAPPG